MGVQFVGSRSRDIRRPFCKLLVRWSLLLLMKGLLFATEWIPMCTYWSHKDTNTHTQKEREEHKTFVNIPFFFSRTELNTDFYRLSGNLPPSRWPGLFIIWPLSRSYGVSLRRRFLASVARPIVTSAPSERERPFRTMLRLERPTPSLNDAHGQLRYGRHFVKYLQTRHGRSMATKTTTLTRFNEMGNDTLGH